jgi:cell division protein FtsZ
MVVTEKELIHMSREVDEKGLEPWKFQILTLGVGRAGDNILDRLTSLKISGTECTTVNTDITRSELIHEIESHAEERNVTFISEEAGKENDTGAAPAIAEMYKKKGAIVIGVVTIPSPQEKKRTDLALHALTEMKEIADTTIVIDNNKLINLTSQPINGAFTPTYEILANMVKGIVETIALPSLINLNFADFKTMMELGELATVGIGESDESGRAEKTAKKAISHLLLDIGYKNASGALIHISGGKDLTLEEAVKTAEIVTKMLDEKALVIWGARVDPSLGNRLRIAILLTGMQLSQILSESHSPEVELFNLEPFAEPEKPLKIELSLYQMENWEK